MRFFRLYGKKRGERRTGSEQLGRFGEVLFSLALTLIGTAGLIFMLSQWLWPEWQANRRFVEQRCEVLDRRVAQRQVDNATLYRPEVLVQYRVDQRVLEQWAYDAHHSYSAGRDDKQEAIDQFEVGGSYRCWYDPSDPTRVVLIRGYTWWLWVLLAIPVAVLIIGGVGAVRAGFHWSTSDERRAMLAQRAAKLELFDDATRDDSGYPNIPNTAHVNDSPGTRLAYRLPIETAGGWAVLSTLLLCVFFNGTVLWIFAGLVRSESFSWHDWPTVLILILLAAVGVFLVIMSARGLLRTAGTGATRIEISDHPLFPGDSYELFLSQTGRLKFNSMEVLLVCEEEATYRQGTDTRTVVQRVCQLPIYRRTSFTVRPGMPFEDRCVLRVPEQAMHSFHSEHNEVQWKLLIQGCVAGWPDYQRSFPVVVYPPNGRSES